MKYGVIRENFPLGLKGSILRLAGMLKNVLEKRFVLLRRLGGKKAVWPESLEQQFRSIDQLRYAARHQVVGSLIQLGCPIDLILNMQIQRYLRPPAHVTVR